MEHSNKKFNIAILSALICVLAPFQNLRATETSVVVQPAKVEIMAAPGQKIAETFSIINRSNFYVRYKIAIKSYRQASEDGKLEFYDSVTEPAADWLVPQYLQIGLKPLETKEVGFIISVPQNFSGGGHYGAILFEPIDGKKEANNLGTLVLLTIKGSNVKSSAIAKTTGFETKPFQQGNPVDFAFKMQNGGNTHFNASAKLVLKDWLGRDVGNYNVGQLTIYPKTSREFKWRWNETPRMGLYKAEVYLSSTEKSEDLKLVDGSWFIIFPWQLALAIFSAAVLIITIKMKKNIFAKKIFNFRKNNYIKEMRATANAGQKMAFTDAIKSMFFKD